MTELTINLDGAAENVAPFPSEVEPLATNDDSLPRVDALRGVFITSRGEEIELSDKPVSSLIVQQLQQQGKPKIPMIEVTLLGKHKQIEPNVSHEGYQARLKEWEADSQLAVLRYLFSVGTKGKPPQDFIDEQVQYFPNATEQEMKYLWVASRLPDEDMEAFTEAVMGRTLPTSKGIEESANSFRG